MKIRVEFEERTRRTVYIEAESVAEVEAQWDLGYDSELVDQIENLATETDGGIDWNSVTIEHVGGSNWSAEIIWERSDDDTSVDVG